ncbi:MAG: type VI secretion system baseplate subunit TssG [Isosphaeraceae bacterium]
MDTEDRREIPSLIELLFREPYRFEFFQAVSLLERDAARGRSDSWRAASNPSAVESVRFQVHQYSGFAASAIHDLKPPAEPPDSDRPRARAGMPPRPVMTVNFMGLTGPQGVLPKLYTTYVRDRARFQGDSATADFLDLFNHRLISLFYRAWEKYRVDLGLDPAEPSALTRVLYHLVGLGCPALRNRQELPDEVILAYAAWFSRQRRTAEGLRVVLSDAFRLPVEIVQFVGRWIEVDPSQQFRLRPTPGGELGGGFVLGERVYDEQSKFRLRIGPLAQDEFRRLLPDGRSFRLLTEMTRFYVGPEFDFDVQLYLAPGAVPDPRAISGPLGTTQVGRYAWFPSSDPAFEHGAIFPSRL